MDKFYDSMYSFACLEATAINKGLVSLNRRKFCDQYRLEQIMTFDGIRYRLKVLAIKLRVKLIALQARQKLKRSNGQGLFIDCGANLGQGFTFFRRYFPKKQFNAVLIEPNPNCISKLEQGLAAADDVELIHAALAKSKGETKLFGLVEDQRGAFSDGASILPVHNSKFYQPNTDEAITVPTQPLSEIIEKNGKGYEAIIIKLDVEGAEYDVFEDLFETGVLDKVYAMFIEFHSQFMEPEVAAVYRLKEDEIRQRLKAGGVRYVEWI